MQMPFSTGFQISSPYGFRIDPLTGIQNSWHGGVDLVGFDKTVRAAMGGTVAKSRIVDQSTGDRTWEWGNYVSVYGDDGRTIFYCHMASRAVTAGQRVEAGQILGVEGMTGLSTGVHLHFEARNAAGDQIDPCVYLGIENRAGYIWTPAAAQEPWEIQSHDWSREAVGWAVKNGILKGRGGDDYALGDGVTREEMIVFLWRAMNP